MADGTCGGTAGGVAASGDWANANVEAGSPTSTAIACSYCARATPLSMAAACADCNCVCAWITSERATVPCAYWFCVSCSVRLIGGDGVVEELLLRVQRTQLEVGLRERALRRETCVGEIGGGALLAGLCALTVRLMVPQRSGSHEASRERS